VLLAKPAPDSPPGVVVEVDERGLTYVSLLTEMFSWQLPLPSADAVWAVITVPVPFGAGLETLADDELALVRSELEQATAEVRAADGSYTFPIACRLFWGSK
jgi:hypothetical protein